MFSVKAKKLSPQVKDCCSEIEKATKLLKQLTSPAALESNDAGASDLFTSVAQLASVFSTKQVAENPDVTMAVNDSNLLAMSVDLLIAAVESADEVPSSSAKTFNGIVGNVCQCLLGIFLNATNWSLDFCRQLSQQEKYFKEFYPRLLSSQDAKQLDSRTGRGNAVYYTIGAAFNAYFKNDSEVFSRLSEFDLVSSTKPYLQCGDTTVSTAALILIAFAVDEKQSDVFLGAKDNIAFLIENLRKALGSPDRSWRGYDVIEVAKCIRRLALNDSNKDLLIELDLLPTVKKLLDSSNDEDVAEGIEILFTLSFSKKFRQKIWKEFREVIGLLEVSPKWSSSKQLQGLVFQLQDASERPGSAASTTSASAGRKKSKKSSRRVMISYNHGSKAAVERLYNLLTEAQVDIWVDFKDMKSGSVYQAMANGIEGSSVVLMCITRLYNESNNCRLEVEYAHECGKKLIPLLLEPKYRPNGWLGFLTRAELRYDLTETKCSFESKVQELLVALQSHFNQLDSGVTSRSGSAVGSQRRGHETPSQPPVLPPIVSQQQHQQLQLQQSTRRLASSVRAWDAEKVTAWCREHGLPAEITERGMSGLELQFLARTLARSPEYFGRVLERHFGLSKLLDLAAFVTAIEELQDCE
ncbi:hypothetical protein BOX15_Mlig005761g4 [Macrostomum lignano]|uniref:TIR domain-containing protein n=1 Tax=Macrostomum lignano TaxID=282301 RepID=A0A267GDI2_9PLAT|nr:hypothetical protein BOX15_Mlig005761g4 [Macrostomum lignano]